MKLTASCTPFEALPPPIWQAFKKQVMDAARSWGLEIAISQDLTVSDAEQRFWMMTRVMDDARAEDAATNDE